MYRKQNVQYTLQKTSVMYLIIMLSFDHNSMDAWFESMGKLPINL